MTRGSSGRPTRILPNPYLGYFAKIEDLWPQSGFSRISTEIHRPLDFDRNRKSMVFAPLFIAEISEIYKNGTLRNFRKCPKCKDPCSLCFSTDSESSSPIANPIRTQRSKSKENPQYWKIGNQRGRAPKAPAPFGGGRRPPYQFFNIEDFHSISISGPLWDSP